jgi:hypothetical protein
MLIKKEKENKVNYNWKKILFFYVDYFHYNVYYRYNLKTIIKIIKKDKFLFYYHII